MKATVLSEEEIFQVAAGLAGESRAAYLREVCADEPNLQSRVERLLASLDDSSFMRSPLDEVSQLGSLERAEEVGQRISHYKLVEKIGEGGFGVVWMAEQLERVRRRVALKIIKLGMDTREVVARFEQERQALAMMDHPNIAKVFDAGATPAGRPFFVMELVPGVRLTDYCDRAKLSIGERLLLFITVCQAVQHAHQKGIIHRDLKPSNILVTDEGGAATAKVIDFGVAKATQSQRLTELTICTHHEQMIGTPLYMSPEQAELGAVDIDTRSDLFSLGVLLYELLAGRTPLDGETLRRHGIDEIRRAVREIEPQAPSLLVRALSDPARQSVAARRQTDAAKLPGLLRDDLDWIVLKALEKDRARRYQAASELAADLQRHLAGEPVQARPASPFYRLRRLARRHKLPLFTAVIVTGALFAGLGLSSWAFVSALLAGLGFSTWAFLKEQQQRRVAERERHAADVQRQLAKANELSSRRRRYVSDIQLAHQALQASQFGRGRRLLDAQRPQTPGEVDLRGWEWRWLWQQFRGEAAATLSRRHERVCSVSFSANGLRVAVGWSDGRVEVRALEGDVPPRQLQDAGAPALVAFSPVDDALVFSSPGGLARRHDFATGRESFLCRAPAEIHDLSFSRDGSRLAILTRGGGGNTPWPDTTPRSPAAAATMVDGCASAETALVIDANDGQILHRLPVPGGGGQFFNNARLSPDHTRLYVTCGAFLEPRLLCLAVADGQLLWERVARTSRGGRKLTGFSAMDLSPDGRLLATATGYEERIIQVWNALTGEPISVLDGHRDYVTALAFSCDGLLLASASADETVRLWDAQTWREHASPLQGNGDEVTAVAFSRDARHVATGSKDGLALLWEPSARSANGRQPLPESTKFAFLIPGGKFAFALSKENQRSYVEVAANRPIPLNLQNPRQGFYGGPNFLGFPDPANGHAFRLYETVESGARLLAELPLGRPFADWFAYSPEKRLLAWTEPGSEVVHLTSIDQAVSEIDLVSQEGIHLPASFDTTGRFLLCVGPGGDARVWDIAARRRLPEAEGFFSPFGMTVFGNLRNALGTNAIREWVSAAVRPRATPLRFTRLDAAPKGFWPPGSVTCRAYSRDGRTTAIATENGSVLLFDAERQEKIATLHGRAHSVFALAFTPDGTRLLSANDAIWDLATAQELVTLSAVGALHSIAQFSDDGNTLLVGSWHGLGEYQFWRAPSWEEIAEVERRGGAWPRVEE